MAFCQASPCNRANPPGDDGLDADEVLLDLARSGSKGPSAIAGLAIQRFPHAIGHGPPIDLFAPRFRPEYAPLSYMVGRGAFKETMFLFDI